MAITEQLLLDLTRAQQQIRDLDNEIDSLLQPVTVPVDIDAGAAVSELRRDLSQVDATIDLDVDGLAEVGRARREAGILADEFSDARREADRVADEARRIKREVNDAGDGVTSFASKARGLVGALAAFEGLRQTFRFIAEGVQDAAALGESLNRINVLFGDLGSEIIDFSENSTAALVLTQREALDAAATFGGLAQTVGLSREQAVDFGTTLTSLATDLASFNDTSVDDAIQAIGSALRGESEPIRRYNVLLNEAEIAAKAAELGLIGYNGELTEAAKVQARYALILEQTVPAQGDLADTLDSLGNRFKTARVDFLEFRQELGTAVTPAIESFLARAPDLLETFGGAAIEVAGTLAILTEALIGAEDAIRSFDDEPRLGGPLDEGFLESPIKGFGVLGDTIRYVNGVIREYAGLWFGSDGVESIGPPNLSPGSFEAEGRAAIIAAGGIETYLKIRRGLADLDGSFAENEARRFEALGGPIRQAEADLEAFIAATRESVAELRAEDSDPFAVLAASFQAGADAFEAIVDEETGNITGSIDEFITALSESATTRATFDADLVTLAVAGFDDLAAVIRERGPEASGLLSEFLTDPTAAAEAERVLEGQSNSLAASYYETFKQAMTGGPANQAYIDSLLAIANAAESPSVRNALLAAIEELELIAEGAFQPTFDLDATFQVNETRRQQGLAPNTGGGGSTATASGAQFQTASQVININNATTEDVETSAAQAAQTLGAISGLVN